MWQFHFSSLNWNCSNSSRSFEREMWTSSFHLNWRWWPVHFIWGEHADKSILSNWGFWSVYFIYSSDERNWSPSPVQMKWTGHHFQFRWNELVTISSSFELELKTQFFNSVHTKCWTWTVTCLLTTGHQLKKKTSVILLYGCLIIIFPKNYRLSSLSWILLIVTLERSFLWTTRCRGRY
jgi:hypothetical protein